MTASNYKADVIVIGGGLAGIAAAVQEQQWRVGRTSSQINEKPGATHLDVALRHAGILADLPCCHSWIMVGCMTTGGGCAAG